MSKRVLVVATSEIGADEVADTIGDRFGQDAEVRVVAPASGVSRLEWLASDEDDARATAEQRATELAGVLPVEDVEAAVGDTDPVQAIDDAIRLFSPDQVVVVTVPDEDATWLESGLGAATRERFGVPVTHVVIWP